MADQNRISPKATLPNIAQGLTCSASLISTSLPISFCAPYPLNFLAAMLALWPPKPKELLIVASTFIWRAVFGT